MIRHLSAALGAAALTAFANTAHAHATIEVKQAPAGSYYKMNLRVPHGCDGSPTVKVRVQIPDGVTGVKPQPKPGWKLTIVKAKYAEPIDDGHGGKITEGVKEITWTGQLLDEHYDEFWARMKLPDKAGETLSFLTVQECKKGVHRWIEVPEAGKSVDDYKQPAPQLKLLPKQ